jgi:aspartate kinase
VTSPERPLVVQKYGGTSLAGAERIRAVADHIAASAPLYDLVVVVSAAAGVTDRLLAEARALSEDPDPEELDALLATGEQANAALLALALRVRGLEARSYNALQLGILTDDAHGRARIRDVDCGLLAADLAAGRIPVVCGFQGTTAVGRWTTLGRGGSDTTAVALAAVLGARECRIYTDVDGVYSADPRIVPIPSKRESLSYEEMIEMAGSGAKVLHIRSVEIAGRHRLPLRVLSSFRDGEGTWVGEGPEGVEGFVLAGLALSRQEAEISILGLPARRPVTARLLAPLAAQGICLDMIVQNVARDGRIDLSFTVPRAEYVRAQSFVRDHAGAEGAESVTGSANVAKISLVGLGLRSHPEVSARLFAILAEEGVAVRMAATAEIRLSVTVHESEAERALRALHERLGLGAPSPSVCPDGQSVA